MKLLQHLIVIMDKNAYIGGREYLLVWPSRMEDGVIYKELFSFFFKVTFFWVFVDSTWHKLQANKT